MGQTFRKLHPSEYVLGINAPVILCPKCEANMSKFIVIEGPHKGQKYYNCDNSNFIDRIAERAELCKVVWVTEEAAHAYHELIHCYRRLVTKKTDKIAALERRISILTRKQSDENS